MSDEVHRTHCCAGIHGCKYMDDDCPVQMKRIPPQYKCQDCEEERQELAQRLAAMPLLALNLSNGLGGRAVDRRRYHRESARAAASLPASSLTITTEDTKMRLTKIQKAALADIAAGEPAHPEIDRLREQVRDLRDLLRAAVLRVELANSEGDPILSAWLPDAIAALANTGGK